MISPASVQTMARYNTWQNGAMVRAADTLDDAARTADRGAFFGSIAATCSHLLWADHMWMSRFDGWETPRAGIADSVGWAGEWRDYRSKRRITDARIVHWAEKLGQDDLTGDLRWHSGATGREISAPRAMLVMHLFNHQTHHRGQIHAMLTAAGVETEPTDLFLMPQPG